jgi:hypothetical protein
MGRIRSSALGAIPGPEREERDAPQPVKISVLRTPDTVCVYDPMDAATTPRFAPGEATSQPLSDLLHRIAARLIEAVRITTEIVRTQRQMSRLLYRRTSGVLVSRPCAPASRPMTRR